MGFFILELFFYNLFNLVHNIYMNNLLAIFISLSAGLVISSAIFSFIAAIGIVPRLARKSRTENYIKVYETSIAIAGTIGASWLAVSFNIDFIFLNVIIAFLVFCGGIFLGVLAVSLAEVMDVIPILFRRAKLKFGLWLLVYAIAFGKAIGTIIYFYVKGSI